MSPYLPPGVRRELCLPPDDLPAPDPDPTQAWTNATDPLDVSDDGAVVAQDALIIINQLNTLGPRALSGPRVGDYLDTNGDGFVSPIDALRVINAINDGTMRIPQAPASGAVTAVPEPSSVLADCLGLLLLYSTSRLPSGTWRHAFVVSPAPRLR